jgi:hypothetical protein
LLGVEMQLMNVHYMFVVVWVLAVRRIWVYQTGN